MTLIKNSIHTLKISSYSHDGEGIGHIDNIAIFVKGALVRETVEAKITKVQKKLCWARLIKVIEPSVCRINPKCKNALKCGGCNLLHMSYDEELKFKLQRVNDAFERIGKIEYKITNIIPSENVNNYRNKATFPVSTDKNGAIKCGIFQARSHNVIDINNCLIQSEPAQIVLNVVRKWMIKYKIPAYDEQSQNGLIRHIFIRTNKNNNVLICLISTSHKIENIDDLIEMLNKQNLDISGVLINVNNQKTNVIFGDKFINLYKNDYIVDELLNIKFKLSVPSFFQVNRKQAKNLYNKAIEYAEINKTSTILDLYCGVGTISLTLAQHAKKVYGIEIVEQAIKNANENAKLNNIENTEFICADVTKLENSFFKKFQNIDAVIVDPPRKGLNEQTIKIITKLNPKTIVYISCDPATLARDLKIFKTYLYNVNKCVLVDMFPKTFHIESIAQLKG